MNSDFKDLLRLFNDRRVEYFDGVPASFISRDDLIAAKTAAGRPQDLLDVDSMIQAVRQTPKQTKRRATKSKKRRG